MTMLKFSREFEHQADFLGVQYLYKAGYDRPRWCSSSSGSRRCRSETRTRSPRRSARTPLTKSRIKAVQKTIDQLLPEQPEYAVSSSEFDDVKERLAKLTARRRPAERDPNRPTLRRSASDEPILPSDVEDEPASDQDERPKLERRSVS